MSSSISSTLPPGSTVVQPNPPSYDKHYRLLYRGSFSLPDSDLVLEGITFVAHVPPSSPELLMDSPIALALESMRGRPSLRLVATVKMSEVHHERTGDIYMYIHPRSTLALSLFENTLCSDEIGPNGHTNTAIRIGLGDGHGPDNSDLLIYGTVNPSQSSLKLTVARMVPPPAPKRPRPDDPAPRRPSVMELHVVNKRRRVDFDNEQHSGDRKGKIRQPITLKSLMARDMVKKKPGTLFDVGDKTKAKGKVKASGLGSSFKTPTLPGHLTDEDVSIMPSSSQLTAVQDLEPLNKTVVKKMTVNALAGRGMPKEHPDFKELFGWITRGVMFALRNKTKIVKIDSEDIQRLVDLHVLMYFDGFGGPSQVGKG